MSSEPITDTHMSNSINKESETKETKPETAHEKEKDKDDNEHGTIQIVRNAGQDSKILCSGETYFSIHFSGCGFMLPYHFGVVAALKDFDVSFSKATASSGGVMAALALLGGADLKLGIRQCFDLRDEKATTPGSIRSFFAVYREYFRCFRSPSYQRDVRLSSLRNKLFVRLGRWTNNGWEIFQVTDFHSEQDLEDAFMSAAYVPFGTSVLPPYFRSSVAYDAVLIDFLSGQIGFAANKASLWPPEDDDEEEEKQNKEDKENMTNKNEIENNDKKKEQKNTKSSKDRTKVLVVPTQGFGHEINPSDLVVVNGKFRSLLDFWAHPSVMERGFVEGYKMAAEMIDTSKKGLPTRMKEAKKKRLEEEESKKKNSGNNSSSVNETLTAEEEIALDAESAAMSFFKEVMHHQKSWKTTEAFVKPPIWFEFDPLFALFIFVAMVVFLLSYLLQKSLNDAMINQSQV